MTRSAAARTTRGIRIGLAAGALAASGAWSPDGDSATGLPLSVRSTWQWQLEGEIDTSYDVDVYDVDLFDAPDETIATLRADGRVVICYFSAGSVEEWRADAGDFPAEAEGEPLDGWEGERWLDIRDETVRAVLERRLDLARERGCDGVEPDNVTAYDDFSGFDLSAADQIRFNRFLAAAAHERGLLVGLKNDGAQVPELVDEFDFAVVEECHEFDECVQFQPFLDQNKPVFVAEYAERYVDDPSMVCADARRRGVRTLILPLELDGSFRISCD